MTSATGPDPRETHLERLIDETPFMLTRCSRDLRYLFVPRGPVTTLTFPINDLRDVHVLAVDDEADALALVSALLEAAGAKVTTARSAEEALDLLGATVPNVLLVVLGMPQVDGIQFLR